MFAVRIFDWTGESSPSRAAFQRLPASTVRSTSAEVRAPSLRSRSNTSLLFPLKNLMSTPVFFVNASNTGSAP